jgi:hypothetical protein
MSLPDSFWELPLAIIAATVAVVGVAWLRRYFDRAMDKKIDDHVAAAHAVDKVRWDGLEKRLDTILLTVHDSDKRVAALHVRIDDIADAPRRDRAES